MKIPNIRSEAVLFRTKRARWLYASLLAGAFGLLSCATTSIRSVRPEAGFDTSHIQRVMVVGLFKNQALRKTFEEEFVRQWKERHIYAASSLEILPPSVALGKAGVAPIAKALEFDSVIVTRLIEKRTVRPGEPALPLLLLDEQNDLQNLNTALQVLLAPPARTEAYDIAAVETNLYDVAAGKRVWSATTETEVIGKVTKHIRPFIQLILKRLYQSRP